jgi:penicillin-binding protein 1A
MADTDLTASENFKYRIRRDTSGALNWFRENWRNKRLFRWTTILLGVLLALWIVVWALLVRGCPMRAS